MNWSEHSEPHHDPRTKQLPEAAYMRRRPGLWVCLEEAPTVRRAGNRAAEIRMGRPVAFRPERHYEATSRGRQVWVRWVGPQTWPAEPPPWQPREIRTTTATTERTPE